MNDWFAGVLYWGGIAIVNLVVLAIIELIKRPKRPEVWVILIAALISDIIVNIALVATGGTEMEMWLPVSFMYVGFWGIAICLLAELAYHDWLSKLFRK